MKYLISLIIICLFIIPLFSLVFYIDTDQEFYEYGDDVTIYFNLYNPSPDTVEVIFQCHIPFVYYINGELYGYYCQPVYYSVTIPPDSTHTEFRLHTETLSVGTHEIIGKFLYVGGDIYSDPIFIEVISTDADEQELLPARFELSNYPNPFNPSTTISFAIPEESVVKIDIFNIKGQKIKTLIDDYFLQGEHKIVWDGDDDSGRHLSSGVYFYRLEVNGKTEAVDKCLLLK